MQVWFVFIIGVCVGATIMLIPIAVSALRQVNKEGTPSASHNTQSAAIAKIAAEMERTVESRKGNVNSVWYVDISKWARQLRAL